MSFEKEPWRFKKEISLVDIISFVSAALAVVYAYTTLDKRLAIIEAERLVERNASVAFQARIDSRLDKMDEKLDRIIQRQQR